jgi:hypothetical protein
VTHNYVDCDYILVCTSGEEDEEGGDDEDGEEGLDEVCDLLECQNVTVVISKLLWHL